MLLLLLLGLAYDASDWSYFPSMDEVRCIAPTTRRVYVAVPRGVYILDRSGLEVERTITAADGLVGEVRLCAHNRARGDLIIVTGNDFGHIVWSWTRIPERATRLSPPFQWVRSLGIADDGAYFDTEQGLFRKDLLLDVFEKVNGLPQDVEWYGARDNSSVRDHPVLVPWFVTDEQLVQHDMSLVREDPRSSRLYVAAVGYGLLAYDERTGFVEDHVRLGPTGYARFRAGRLGELLWFTSGEHAITVNRNGRWRYYRTQQGDITGSDRRLLFEAVADLQRREGATALLADSGPALVGTGDGLYRVDNSGETKLLLDLPVPVNGIARRDGSVLIGTDAGLFAWTGDSITELDDPFGRTVFGVYAVARTESGETWFGTIGGLLRLDADGEWQHIIPPGFDLSGPASALAAAGDKVFFGDEGGITVYDAADSGYTRIDENAGLVMDDIEGLLAGPRYLWIVGDEVIARLDHVALLGE